MLKIVNQKKHETKRNKKKQKQHKTHTKTS